MNMFGSSNISMERLVDLGVVVKVGCALDVIEYSRNKFTLR